MTVKKLIAQLENLEPDARVVFTSDFLETQHDIVQVALEFEKDEETGIDKPLVVLAS